MFKRLTARSATRASSSSTADAGREGSSASLLGQSQDWEADRTEALERSEARAWQVARATITIALLAVAALLVMIPFYKIVPAVFQVDRATGEIMQVTTDPTSIKPSEQMLKYWLGTYVSLRERYHWTLLNDDYDTTLLLSDEIVAREYRAIYDGPNALDKKLGEGTDIRVRIISVELSPNEPEKRGTVRWERRTRRNNQDAGGVEYFSSAVSFKFSPPNVFSREKQLIANPMGFKVDGYAVASVLVSEKQK